jgi:hypothetical protein
MGVLLVSDFGNNPQDNEKNRDWWEDAEEEEDQGTHHQSKAHI